MGTSGRSISLIGMRYFFHLHNDVDLPDHEGRELTDEGAARTYAREMAQVMAAESVRDEGHLNLAHHVDVIDEQGMVLFTISFADVVSVFRGASPEQSLH
jgi:hypothetical protein